MTSEAIPREFPPVVYLPCAEQVSEANNACIDMRETRDGRIALLAYSALDRLHTCCGDDQPWVLMPTRALDELQKRSQFQLLLLDVVIPDDKRREAQR